MKPILIHYPYAINREHQQLQTSIKGGETPEKSAQQFIKNISFFNNTTNKYTWQNSKSLLRIFLQSRHRTTFYNHVHPCTNRSAHPSHLSLSIKSCTYHLHIILTLARLPHPNWHLEVKNCTLEVLRMRYAQPSFTPAWFYPLCV